MPFVERADRSVEVSVVVPAYNESEVLPRLHARVRAVLEAAGYSYELLVVDDGSTDCTLEVLRRLQAEDPHVRSLTLSRNFGHQAAQMAGLAHSRGAVVVTMDADLQHPPELLPEMLELWEAGYEVVNTRKTADGEHRLRRRTVDALFYLLLQRWSGLEVHGSDFRLLDRRVVQVLLATPERQKLPRGLVAWLGFKQTTLPYTVGKRAAGEPKYTVHTRFGLALNALFSFSILPLHALTVLGVAATALALAYLFGLAGYALFVELDGGGRAHPPGWAVLTGVVGFFGGVQLLAVGILGQYLGRVYVEVKGRPTYVVKEISGVPAPAAAPVEETAVRWRVN